MAVHVPLSAEAQAEARILMLSAEQHPLAGARRAAGHAVAGHGAGGLLPDLRARRRRSWTKIDLEQGQAAARTCSARRRRRSWPTRTSRCRLQDIARLPARRPGTTSRRRSAGSCSTTGSSGRWPETLGDKFDPAEHEFINQTLTKREISTLVSTSSCSTARRSVALVLDAFKDLGFHYASQAGITISKNDVDDAAREGADPRALRERGRRGPVPVRAWA